MADNGAYEYPVAGPDVGAYEHDDPVVLREGSGSITLPQVDVTNTKAVSKFYGWVSPLGTFYNNGSVYNPPLGESGEIAISTTEMGGHAWLIWIDSTHAGGPDANWAAASPNSAVYAYKKVSASQVNLTLVSGSLGALSLVDLFGSIVIYGAPVFPTNYSALPVLPGPPPWSRDPLYLVAINGTFTPGHLESASRSSVQHDSVITFYNGYITHVGSGIETLPLVTGSGTGEWMNNPEGSGTISLPITSGSGDGIKIDSGHGSPLLQQIQCNGDGFVFKFLFGSGSITLPQISSHGHAVDDNEIRDVFYSVGADIASNLMTGTPTAAVADGVISFSADQIGNIGCGDIILCGSSRYFLNYKINNKTWTVLDSRGYVPADAGAVAVTSIRRCFSGIDAAIGSADGVTCRPTGAVHSDFLGTRDLEGASVRLFIMCYHSATVDESGAVIVPGHISTGFLTTSYNNIVVEAPGRIGSGGSGSGRVRSNFYQHVIGSGYNISGGIVFQDVNAIINGIEISGSPDIGIHFSVSRVFDCEEVAMYCRRCLIHNSGSYGVAFEGVYDTGATIDNAGVFGCIIYGQSVSQIRKGEGIMDSFTVYQSTIDVGDGGGV